MIMTLTLPGEGVEYEIDLLAEEAAEPIVTHPPGGGHTEIRLLSNVRSKLKPDT